MKYYYLTILFLSLISCPAFSQGVGINQTSPASMLDINGGVTIGSGYSGTNTAPANGLIVEGSVGIGTSSATGKLSVESTADKVINSTYTGTDNTGIIELLRLNRFTSGVAANGMTGRIYFYGERDDGATTGGAAIDMIASSTAAADFTGDLALSINSLGGGLTEVMRITASKRVGIGTSAPVDNFEVYSSINGGTTSMSITNGFGAASSTDETVSLNFNVHNGSAIKTAAVIRAGKEQDFTSAANEDGFLAFYTKLNSGSTEWMRITSDGKVGIGTSTPVAVVDVRGTHSSASANTRGILLAPTTNSSGDGIGGISLNPTISPTANQTTGFGITNTPQLSGTSNFTIYQGVFVRPDLGAGYSGTVTTMNLARIEDPIVSGGTVTTAVGLSIGNITAGTSNYAIRTFGTNPSTFQGFVSAGQSTTPSSAMDINSSNGYNQLRLRTSYTPTGTADTNGNTGDIAWDANYIYIKTAAGWKRAALSTF